MPVITTARGGLSIAAAAAGSGVAVATIRYYERIGLIPEPRRGPGGRRRFSAAEVRRLAFIRRARRLGFSLDAVGELLALSDGGDCAAVRTLTERQLALVRARLAELRTIEAELDGLADACREPAARCLAIDRLHEAPDGPSASLGRP
jgi:MerR family mercuric resistance operon transcriptional regulator